MAMQKNPNQVVRIATSSLNFDPENPRFYRLNNAHSVPDVIEEMLDDEGAQDLMRSIGQKGYFEGEPLLVTEENGEYVVVEGNRRLAAVKLLNQQILPPARRGASVAQIRAEAIEDAPTELPCILYSSRREIMRYLGYRHITGIREWDALSKAKYLADIRREFYPELSQPEQMKSLARDIGSRSDYVAQLLTALSLYIHADEANFFGLPIQAKDVEFSYLTTALSYSKITDWLGLEGRTDIDMPGLDTGNLKRAFAWMFSKNAQGRTIIGESRNLDQLAEVVSSPESVQMLEETGKLSEAYLYSEGPQVALEKALELASERVRFAWNMLPKTKPLTTKHLELAETLSEDSRSIRSYLREKLED
ncbi:MAG: ParB N-terminal domain-containing protein [Sulfurimicrobium sp.]|nr:ParB N-terminal domain-containing protein [Sulfurimicrobium sp.]